MALDKVHIQGMSENISTYLTVTSVAGDDNKEIRVEPPIKVVLEGEGADSVAISQGSLAASYDNAELAQIGEGSSILGLKKVIGAIATDGLTYDDIKPLHPNLLEGQVIDTPALSAIPLLELTT